MKRSDTIRRDLIALVLFILLVGVRFWHLISRINSIFFHQYGDAVKNYFTTAYYVSHDSGWTFHGMNYPYGDILPFTDNQPLLSLMLNFIDDHIFQVAPYSIGIINSLMLLSIALCAFFAYKVLRHYGCSYGFAIAGGLIVSFLSPQLDRMDVHFALGYSFFIPLTWWLTLKLRDSETKWWQAGLMTINIVAQSFIHLYFLMISGLFILAYLAAGALINWRIRWIAQKGGLHLLSSLMIAAIVVMGVMKITDPVSDRPSNPWGINNYVTDPASVFLPTHGVLHDWFGTDNTGEGEAYIGFIGGLLLLLMLGKALNYLLFQRHRWSSGIEGKEWVIFLTGGWLAFLYASGWLNQLGLSYLNEVLPPLKQFRSLGRLAWITYYTTTIGGLIFLFRYVYHSGRYTSRIRVMITSALLFLWGVDAHLHSSALTRDFEDWNIFEHLAGKHTELESAQINQEHYQAILTLPLQVLGPEWVEITRGTEVMRWGMAYSMVTGLPLMDIMMSRTSGSQGLDLVELLSPTYVKKGRLEKMDGRPILILAREEDLTEAEKNVYDLAKPITEIDGLTLRSLDPEMLYERIGKDRLGNMDRPLLHFGLNDGHLPAFAGKSAHQVEDLDQIWLGTLPDTSEYEASFWIHSPSLSGKLPRVHFTKLDPDGATMWEGDFNFREDILAQLDWIRVSWRFEGFPNYDIFKIEIQGKDILIDEFELRKVSSTSVHHTGNTYMINNYLLESFAN